MALCFRSKNCRSPRPQQEPQWSVWKKVLPHVCRITGALPVSSIVIGVDEVGRGCLAGPVCVGAVILPDPLPDWVADVRDSKKISAGKRKKLSDSIERDCRYAVREASPHLIDQMNILYATLWAMSQAVDCLYRNYGSEIEEAVILVDGNKTIPTADVGGQGWLSVPWKQVAVPGGDGLDKSIGAASILAKVYRDRYMSEYADKQWPGYGFAQHVGYGTPQHREAIKQLGPIEIHRKTFGGVREYV